jgi:hypothetical protein
MFEIRVRGFQVQSQFHGGTKHQLVLTPAANLWRSCSEDLVKMIVPGLSVQESKWEVSVRFCSRKSSVQHTPAKPHASVVQGIAKHKGSIFSEELVGLTTGPFYQPLFFPRGFSVGNPRAFQWIGVQFSETLAP